MDMHEAMRYIMFWGGFLFSGMYGRRYVKETLGYKRMSRTINLNFSDCAMLTFQQKCTVVFIVLFGAAISLCSFYI